MLAFYASFISAIALSLVKSIILSSGTQQLNAGFLVGTFLMMTLAVVGMRSVYALPISLTANWILRITQIHQSRSYLAFTRRSLLLLAVLPAWLLSALLTFAYRPWLQTVSHLLILAFFGSILVDLSLFGFHKIPFTCSYLPGKSNLQFVFWGAISLLLVVSLFVRGYEIDALRLWRGRLEFIGAFAIIAAALRLVSLAKMKSAVVAFEDVEPDQITALKLVSGENLRSESSTSANLH